MSLVLILAVQAKKSRGPPPFLRALKPETWKDMRLLGKVVFPRQIVLFASGLLFLGATTYDVHRSINANVEPPSKEQVQALQDYIDSKRTDN